MIGVITLGLALLAAEPATSMTFDWALGECTQVDVAFVARLLHIELRPLANPSGGGAGGNRPIGIATECRDAELRVRVDDPVSGSTLERALDWQATPTAARSRLLALAVAELLASARGVRAVQPADTPAKPAAAPAAPPAELPTVGVSARAGDARAGEPGAPDDLRRTSVNARAGWARLSPSLPAALSITLAAQGSLHRRWAWSAEVNHRRAAREVSLGRVDLRATSLAGGVMLGRQWGPVILRAGPALEGGVATWSGHAEIPEENWTGTYTGLWVAALVRAQGELSLGRRWFALLTAEAGTDLLGSAGTVAGRREVALHGWRAAAQMGLGFRL